VGGTSACVLFPSVFRLKPKNRTKKPTLMLSVCTFLGYRSGVISWKLNFLETELTENVG
jgi:hypothetical protein